MHHRRARADRGAVQRELVRRIYNMRVDVENIYTVLRHSANAPTAVLMTAVIGAGGDGWKTRSQRKRVTRRIR